MPFRKFETSTWDKPWFENLSDRAKLLFIFLWTNSVCNQAGVYQISVKKIEANLGYDSTEYFPELDEKIFWDKDRHIVWVKNFFKHQCQNAKFAKGAINSINGVPEDIKTQWFQYNRGYLLELEKGFSDMGFDIKAELKKYGKHTISKPYAYKNRTEAETEEEQKNVENPEAFRLASLLFELIKQNDPKARSPDLNKWTKSIGLLISRDKRPPDEVEKVIKWCQEDEFWQSNILSAKKLREKYQQLKLQMERKKKGRGGLKGVPEDWADKGG